MRRTARHDEARCALGDAGPQRSLSSLFPRPQRVSLGLLNYLRSLERTLTFDLAGLQLEEGELCSTAEETGWMNAARGGGGEAGGLGSLQFSHNTPVDCKVRTEILIGRSVCWKQEHYFLFSINFTKSH